MPETLLSNEQTTTSYRPYNRFFETLVQRSLQGMNKGFLRVTLPDGRRWVFGEPGTEVEASIVIRDPELFRQCVLFGDVGFGESFVDGHWETDQLTNVIRWMILNVEMNPSMSGSRRRLSPVNWLQSINRLLHTFRSNTRRGSRKNIRAHYDLSNEFFQLFLDPSMTYSAGLFERADESLERAQWRKYDRLCRKLQLKNTDHVLEIGCGWGGFALHAARHYGCRVTGITVSTEQLEYAKARVQNEGLSDQIEIRFQDYRSLQGSFDKIVSIEMLEAVGHEFLPVYFAKCHEVLKPHGLVGLQVITCQDSRYNELRQSVDWIQKHIFPGSLLPSVSALNAAVHKTGDMVLHHLEDLAPHYVKTLRTWRANLKTRAVDVRRLGFDERFERKWEYYFSYCEAAFAMRNIAVLQMVYTRPNNWTL